MSFGEMSIRRNVYSGKCHLGNCPFGELFIWGIFCSGNCLSGSCPSGKCLRGTVCVAKVRWGNVCWGTVLEPRLLCNSYRLISFICKSFNMLNHQVNHLYANVGKLIKKLCTKSFPIEEHTCFFMSQFVFLSELFINALVSIFERIQQQLNIDNYTIDIFVDLTKSIWYSGPWYTD